MTNIALFIFGIIYLIAFVVLVAGLVNPNLSLFDKLPFLRTKTNSTKRIYLLGIFSVLNIIVLSLPAPNDTETLSDQTESVANISDEEIKKDSMLLDRCKTLFDELMTFKDKQDFKLHGFGTGGKYHKWLNEKIKDFSDEEKKRLLTVYGIIPGEIEQLALDYALPPKTAEGIKGRTERENRLKRIFDFQIRNDSDFSDEAEQAYNDDRIVIGKWQLSSKQGMISSILEIYSYNDCYYYGETYNDRSSKYKKLIKKGNYYYDISSATGDYFIVHGKKLSIGDDGGVYEDGTKEFYLITYLE